MSQSCEKTKQTQKVRARWVYDFKAGRKKAKVKSIIRAEGVAHAVVQPALGSLTI